MSTSAIAAANCSIWTHIEAILSFRCEIGAWDSFGNLRQAAGSAGGG
jgi:hypothetical protein